MDEKTIQMFFGGLEKLGPGTDEDTLFVLDMLPQKSFDLIVDAGCGSGRQSLAIANKTQTLVHALDLHRPFLDELDAKTIQRGIEPLIETHCMDILEIATRFSDIDLLWSEGAAYNIGFENALKSWREAIKPKGHLVASELTWLASSIPNSARDFFETGYPDMKTYDQNAQLIRGSGYELLATHTLPRSAWTIGYYDELKLRAEKLSDHENESVREFAKQTIQEIKVFEESGDCYGYVFYAMTAT